VGKSTPKHQKPELWGREKFCFLGHQTSSFQPKNSIGYIGAREEENEEESIEKEALTKENTKLVHFNQRIP